MRELQKVKHEVKYEPRIKLRYYKLFCLCFVLLHSTFSLCMRYDDLLNVSFPDDGFQLFNKGLLSSHYVLGTLPSTEWTKKYGDFQSYENLISLLFTTFSRQFTHLKI